MLFYLENVKNGSVFYLINKIQFLIGRRDCDILIQNDQSISRKHAIIRLKESKVTVEDCGSKYKTIFKDENLKPNEEIEMAPGDVVQFGVSDSIYRLHKFEFVTTGTRLSSSVKTKLINDLSTLNGKYVEQWTPQCTHLTVEEITLTIKFLHALIDERPIVKPTYWAKFAERAQKNLPPPNIDQHNKPPVAEALLNKVDFKPNPERKTLFKGKLFIFPKEKDKKQLEDIIKKSGGTSISWDKDPMPMEDIRKSPKEFLIIQTADTINDESLNQIIKEFAKQNKRTIPMREIATAIVYCSCERDCNPNFNRVEQVFPTSGPREPSQNNVLVDNTQSEVFVINECKSEGPSYIPDTFEQRLGESQSFAFPSTSRTVEKDINNSQSVKRLNDDTSQETPLKKVKMDSENKKIKVKQEKDNFITKKSSPMKTVTENTILDKGSENNDEIKANPFAFLNRNKKNKGELNSTSTNNPFRTLKKESAPLQISEENPFKSSLSNKKRSNEDDLSHEREVCKKKRNGTGNDSIFSSNRNENITHNSSALSRISRVSKDLNNSTWMSKSVTGATTFKKEDVEDQFDLELKHFVEQFKDTVVIEIMGKIPSKPKIFRDCVDGDQLAKGKINFKVFKKVMPLRPQTRIERISFNAVGPAETTGIADSRREFHKSDDEAEVSKPRKKMPKKFVI